MAGPRDPSADPSHAGLHVRQLLPLGLLLLPACKDGGKGGDGGDSAGVTEVAITVTMSEIVPTVATVTFDPAELSGVDGATIRFGRDGALDQEAVADLDDGETVVLGMKPGSSYSVQLVADDGSAESPVVDVTTGALDNDLPGLFLDEELSGEHSGGYVVTSFVSPPTAMILDRDGDIVWWYRPTGVIQLGRVHLSRDGQRVFMADINLQGNAKAELISVALDGSDEQRVDIPYRHHDFVELPDGTLTFIAHDPMRVDDQTIKGDQLVELSPDGTQTQVYTVWDHHEAGAGNGGGGPGGVTGWAHANAVDYLPDDDVYLVSFLHMEGVAVIERATGDELHFIGGTEATVSGPGAPDEFGGGQHGMDWLDDDTMLLFVNGEGNESRVVELKLDLDGGSFTESWRYQPGLGTPILGDVKRMDDGRTLAIFSYNGELHDLDASGALTWRLSASLGGAMSYLGWVQTLPTGGRAAD